MLNYPLIEERLTQIRVSCNRLKQMEPLNLEEFLTTPDSYAIAEHHLRRALESVFDIGRHIIAKQGLGKPANYRQIIEILAQQEIIPLEFSRNIHGLAGYRNRLVHEYAKITPEEIHRIIQERLDDFALFSTYILNYLETERKPDST